MEEKRYGLVPMPEILSKLKQTLEERTGLVIIEISLRSITVELTPDLLTTDGDNRWGEIQKIVDSTVAEMLVPLSW
jgi:hypothetical protein